jgi:glycosyltransferase involved in cell wall biosynthesis
VGEVHRIIVPGQTGLIVPPRTPAALAQALHHILSSTDGGVAMGLAGADRVHAHYSSQSMAAHYLHVYQSSLG